MVWSFGRVGLTDRKTASRVETDCMQQNIATPRKVGVRKQEESCKGNYSASEIIANVVNIQSVLQPSRPLCGAPRQLCSDLSQGLPFSPGIAVLSTAIKGTISDIALFFLGTIGQPVGRE